MRTITMTDAEYSLVTTVLEEAAASRLAWAREEAEEAAITRKLLRQGRITPVERAKAAADEAREMAAHWRKQARTLSRLAQQG